jgi:uncharacterized protein DUF6527
LTGRRVKDAHAVWHGEPGDYALVESDDGMALWAKLPTGSLARLRVQQGGPGSDAPPVWGYTEHSDGTVTITPSINQAPVPGHVEGWHGFLERGEWRTA